MALIGHRENLSHPAPLSMCLSDYKNSQVILTFIFTPFPLVPSLRASLHNPAFGKSSSSLSYFDHFSVLYLVLHPSMPFPHIQPEIQPMKRLCVNPPFFLQHTEHILSAGLEGKCLGGDLHAVT